MTDFIILGVTDNLLLGSCYLKFFLIVYIVTVLENLGLVVLIRVIPCLHTLMHFFLPNLSFLDVSFCSITSAKTLANLLSKLQVITYLGCVTQMGLIIFTSTGWNILASMAICHPLLYNVTKSRVYYLLLVVGCKLGGLVNMISVITSITELSFCQWHVLSHFYDIPLLLALACSDPIVHPDLDYWLRGTHPSHFHCGDPCTLYVCHYDYPENSLSFQQRKNFLYLYFPLNCYQPVLWNNCVHLLAALLICILGKKSDVFSVLYNGDPHVKSSYLQFEKKKWKLFNGRYCDRFPNLFCDSRMRYILWRIVHSSFHS